MNVEVLLATYNGSRYLPEQVESILAQQDVNVSILAHDDGSTDSSAEILAGYARQIPGTFRVLDDAIRTGGARFNFLHLLRHSRADYVAFSDQDDVWLPFKLSRSLQAMQELEASYGTSLPLLVYSDLRVVDSALNTVSDSLWASNGLIDADKPTFARLLSENVATGCTTLLNRPLAHAMLQMPAEAQMHDHWAALLASSMGAMRAIPEATILYRQHDSNVVGAVAAQPSLLAKLLRFVSKAGADDRERQASLDRAQAARLLELHGPQMPEDKLETLQGFLRLPRMPLLERFRAASRFGFWRLDRQRRLAQMIDLLR